MNMKKAKKILVTGGLGFIGGSLIQRLLKKNDQIILNIDKNSYASDFKRNKDISKGNNKYFLKKIDLKDEETIKLELKNFDPDYIFHFAAESHVDRSIESPKPFLESNIIGTYNLLEAAKEHWYKLPINRKNSFRFHHISTDEVFGSLGKIGQFKEDSQYKPNSPYSASKAASDHLVRAWHHTFGLPVLITNCSNNFGPYQFPEKLIPLSILKALNKEPIPIYGDGQNIRDWLYIEDHIDALLLVAEKGKPGESFCIGGNNERSNIQIVKMIYHILNELDESYFYDDSKIRFVKDRLGHDKRYAINSDLIKTKLGWVPNFSFEEALGITVKWYVNNQKWCKYMTSKLKK